MRQAFWNVEQIAGYKNPVRTHSGNFLKHAIMSGMIAVEVQIADLDCPSSGERRMMACNPGYLGNRQANFPGVTATEYAMERSAETLDCRKASPEPPPKCPQDHPMTLLS